MLEHSMSRPSAWRWLSWLGVSAGVVVLDQVSKHLVRDLLASGSIRVTSFLDLVLILNAERVGEVGQFTFLVPQTAFVP